VDEETEEAQKGIPIEIESLKVPVNILSKDPIVICNAYRRFFISWGWKQT
jgi:hypothetical protein